MAQSMGMVPKLAGPMMRQALLNTLIATLATLFVLFGTGAWDRKENAADHKSDMLEISNKLDRVLGTDQRILDAICQPTHPLQRVCKSTPESR